MVHEIRPILKIMCIVLIVASVIVNLACFKWRKLANSILYLEFTYQFIITALPSNNQGNVDHMYIFIMHYLGFLIYYCDSLAQIITLVLGQVLTMFLIMPIIYNGELTGQQIFIKIFLSVG